VNAPGARLVEFTDKVSTLTAHFWGRELMEVVHPRCSGLDVHKETVVACVRLALDGQITREVRTFETTTSGLLLLLAWLTELGCTHVAMEATGVYWKPVWNILSDGDFELAGAGLVMLLPLLAVVSLAIKLDSRGPVIFRQSRRGFNGREFLIWKFRTMTVTESGRAIYQAKRNDKRVTGVGHLWRVTSIDELPQLVNVLRGEMSLVGPRPHAIAHDDEYGRSIGTYAFRHHVKPGITGWAQVNGFRGGTRELDWMKKRIELDLRYIDNWSFWLDLWIIVRTCFEVARSRNSY
jgi:lipopolysaccharide/colanic/teichoic acid biosynthesis glycosyltransferase